MDRDEQERERVYGLGDPGANGHFESGARMTSGGESEYVTVIFTVVPRDEGPGRASYFNYDASGKFRSWSTIGCGAEYVIARVGETERAWLLGSAQREMPSGDAEEIVQETLYLATRGAHTLRRDANPFAFLNTILKNVVRDMRKKKARRASFETLDGIDVSVTTDVDTWGFELPEETQAKVQVAHGVLSELPPAVRAAVQLIDFEGLSLEEAAKRLDSTPGAVKRARSRGRKNLGPSGRD